MGSLPDSVTAQTEKKTVVCVAFILPSQMKSKRKKKGGVTNPKFKDLLRFRHRYLFLHAEQPIIILIGSYDIILDR